MSAATLVSVEEYLANPGTPESEYLDGALRRRSMPTLLHSIIQTILVALLRRQGVRAFAEVSIRPAPNRFLIPDVIAGRNIGDDPYPTVPVTLCIEVLSPDDRLSAMFAKCEEFHEWGTPYCWVIDPVRRSAWEYHAQSDPSKVDRRGTLHAGELRMNLEELFSAAEAELKA